MPPSASLHIPLYLHRLLALSTSPAPAAQALSNQYTAKHSLPVPAPVRGASHSRRPAFSYPVFLSLHCYQLRLKPFCHQMRFAAFALPAPACPARSLPHFTYTGFLLSPLHFTYTGFLLSPLRLHQPPKRFQTNIPPSTACLCLPPPAGLHISAAPLFSYPVFLSLHCYQLRLKPFCHQMRFAAFAPLGLPLILRKEKLFSLYPLIRQTPRSTCSARRGSHFRRQSSPPRAAAFLIFIRPAALSAAAPFPDSAPPLQKTPSTLRHATLDKTGKGNLPFFCRYVNEK